MKFSLGRVVCTIGAHADFSMEEMILCLNRHMHGEWGDLSEDDKEANELAIEFGDRILSSYKFPDGRVLWLITEADRSVTTILRPKDY